MPLTHYNNQLKQVTLLTLIMYPNLFAFMLLQTLKHVHDVG